jgi:hypothetical protein
MVKLLKLTKDGKKWIVDYGVVSKIDSYLKQGYCVIPIRRRRYEQI